MDNLITSALFETDLNAIKFCKHRKKVKFLVRKIFFFQIIMLIIYRIIFFIFIFFTTKFTFFLLFLEDLKNKPTRQQLIISSPAVSLLIGSLHETTFNSFQTLGQDISHATAVFGTEDSLKMNFQDIVTILSQFGLSFIACIMSAKTCRLIVFNDYV